MAESVALSQRLDVWRRDLHRMTETVSELEGHIAGMAELIDDEDGEREIDLTGWALLIEDQAAHMSNSIERLRHLAHRVGHGPELSDLKIESDG